MQKFEKKNYFYVLLLSLGISLVEYLWVLAAFSEQIQIIRLTQFFALTALAYIYLALVAEPLRFIFKNNSHVLSYAKEKAVITTGALYFGLLHSGLAFFGQLGGFPGLAFLSGRYLLAVSLSFTALLLLVFLTVAAFTRIKILLHVNLQKLLNALLYTSGLLVLIHALMLGTHFQDLLDTIPQIVFTAIAFLLVIEGLRIDAWARKHFVAYPNFGYASVVVLGGIIAGFIYFFLPVQGENSVNFGIHSQHIQLAKEAQRGSNTPQNNAQATIPGLKGDRTRRYAVSFSNPENVQANQDVALSFQVYDAASGNKVALFNKINDKIVHFIVVDSELQYFNHIHPEQSENEFAITTQFPHAGRYHLYLDFQPFGAIEQQMAFTLDVGPVDEPAVSKFKPDANLTKRFGEYEVTLQHTKPLVASRLSVGQQLLTYTVKDAGSKKPITTLKPYLAAFGHVVMINTKTYDYIHVHPNDLKVPKPDQNGGPTVAFMPIGLYGPIKPGVYRLFGQFNPDNNLFTSDFTVEIK